MPRRRETPRRRPQDRLPVLSVRQRELNLPVEPSGASQCIVDILRTVSGSDDNDVLVVVEAVHQRQKLRDDSLGGLVSIARALSGDAVNLVEKNNRPRLLRGSLEDRSQDLLALAVPLAEDLRPADLVERGVSGIRDDPGEHCLTGAG